MPKHCKPWTTGEERLAVSLRRSGLKVAAVATRLGRTHGSVLTKLIRLGATVRTVRRRSGELMRAVARYAGKMPDWEVGLVLGVSTEAACKARNRLGVPSHFGRNGKPRRATDAV